MFSRLKPDILGLSLWVRNGSIARALIIKYAQVRHLSLQKKEETII